MSDERCCLGLLKSYCGQPLGTSKLGHVITLGVHEAMRAQDLAILAKKGMIGSIRHPHDQAPGAADTEIDRAMCNARPLAAPPLPEMLGLRPRLKQQSRTAVEPTSELDLPV